MMGSISQMGKCTHFLEKRDLYGRDKINDLIKAFPEDARMIDKATKKDVVRILGNSAARWMRLLCSCAPHSYR